MPASRILTGLDVLAADNFKTLSGRRVGLLAHPASIDGRLRHATKLFAESGTVDLRCIFGPQHGLRGETQDNMVEWDHYRDPLRGVPVHSLYGDVRRPTADMLADLDTLVVDLQDVGARYYTFIWTLLYCLEACASAGKQVIVLDRPNPLGGGGEGNVLDPAFKSFVGLAPIPMRHGMTIAELALYFTAHFKLDVELETVLMQGWSPESLFDETGLPWVMPSPNMPTLETALVYPGACLLEGTDISEGRGTTRPFEILGAPWIDAEALATRLYAEELPGVVFRPLHFEPTFQKHAGLLCGGVQLHVTDRHAFRPVLTYVAIMMLLRQLWPEEFTWRRPPYEYELDKMPIDILAGGPRLREAIDAGIPAGEIVAEWRTDRQAFAESARKWLCYV